MSILNSIFIIQLFIASTYIFLYKIQLSFHDAIPFSWPSTVNLIYQKLFFCRKLWIILMSQGLQFFIVVVTDMVLELPLLVIESTCFFGAEGITSFIFIILSHVHLKLPISILHIMQVILAFNLCSVGC